MALAVWIADYYVAPLSEAIKLFFPPGLLSKADGSTRVRTKRELKIALQVPLAEAVQRLPTMGRETQQTRVLAWLLKQDQPCVALALLQRACSLKTPASIKTLARQGILAVTEPSAATITDSSEPLVRLALPKAEVEAHLRTLQGVNKYRPLLQIVIWRCYAVCKRPA